MKNNDTNFQQLVVWPGYSNTNKINDFVKFFKDSCDVRIKYDSVQITLPDLNDGIIVPNTGGRNDIFFYVHKDDIDKFAMPRLAIGCKWWEDMLGNGYSYLYSKEFLSSHPTTWEYDSGEVTAFKEMLKNKYN